MKKIRKTMCVLLVLLTVLLLGACGQKAETPADDPAAKKCTISVSCATILTADTAIAKEKAEYVPEDGWILTETEVAFTEGDTAAQVLQRVCKDRKIPMDFEESVAYGVYVKGIGNIYEGDCGELSYWTYTVNGEFLDLGCGLYEVQEGDEICMLYSCNMGADVGLDMSM